MQVLPMNADSDYSVNSSLLECRDGDGTFNSGEEISEHVDDIHGSMSLSMSHEVEQECPLCGVKFTRKHNMIRHLRGVHSLEVPLPRSNKDLTRTQHCSECSMTFTRKCNLIRHLRKCHNFDIPSKATQKPKLYTCTQCNTKFTKQANCRRHIRKFHELQNLPAESNLHILDIAGCFYEELESAQQSTQEVSGTSSAPDNEDTSDSTASDDEACPLEPICHLDNAPENDVILELRPNQTCADCQKTFSNVFNLKRHVQRCHPQRQVTSSNNSSSASIWQQGDVKKCPLCEFKANKLNLYGHFSSVHHMKIVIECHEFDSAAQCEEWRTQVETESGSQFVRLESDLETMTSRTVWICSRSGTDSTGFCPAEITINADEEKRIAYYVKSHVGHD